MQKNPALILPAGVAPANRESERNIRRALACLREEIRSCFVVSGPPGSGKTRLVISLLSTSGIDVSCHIHEEKGSIRFALERALQMGLPAVCIEDVEDFYALSPRRVSHVLELRDFVTSPRVKYRPLMKWNFVEKVNRMVVFVCMSDEDIPSELREVAGVIRLERRAA